MIDAERKSSQQSLFQVRQESMLRGGLRIVDAAEHARCCYVSKDIGS